MKNEQWQREMEQKLDDLLQGMKEMAEENRRMFQELQQAEYELDRTSRRIREAVDTVREGDSGVWAAMEIANLKPGYGEPGYAGMVPERAPYVFQ